eukprot:XP_020400275.1 protein TsetseEP-like [Zea mays]
MAPAPASGRDDEPDSVVELAPEFELDHAPDGPAPPSDPALDPDHELDSEPEPAADPAKRSTAVPLDEPEPELEHPPLAPPLNPADPPPVPERLSLNPYQHRKTRVRVKDPDPKLDPEPTHDDVPEPQPDAEPAFPAEPEPEP